MDETSGRTVGRVTRLVWLRALDRVRSRMCYRAKYRVWWLVGDRVDTRVQRSVGGRAWVSLDE